MSQIESENHFLLVGPLHTELKRKFFKLYFCHWPNLNKSDQHMLSNSKQVTLNIAKFIFSAQELRKNLLLCKQRLYLVYQSSIFCRLVHMSVVVRGYKCYSVSSCQTCKSCRFCDIARLAERFNMRSQS